MCDSIFLIIQFKVMTLMIANTRFLVFKLNVLSLRITGRDLIVIK